MQRAYGLLMRLYSTLARIWYEDRETRRARREEVDARLNSRFAQTELKLKLGVPLDFEDIAIRRAMREF